MSESDPANPFRQVDGPVEVGGSLAEPVAPGPAAAGWDTPTVASPTIPGQPASAPGAELARQEFPGFAAPLDPALEGVTEVLGAHPVGLPGPEGEGLEDSALDALFGDDAFIDYGDEPIIAPLAPRASTALAVVDRPAVAPGAREPIPRIQKILMGVAGGLVAVLALIALFLLGQRIAQGAPAPAVAPSPSPSASPSALPAIGPVAVGQHLWNELLGGECLTPFQSAWQDTYTVVSCSQPHQGQLVAKGLLADLAGSAYPGAAALQARILPFCTAPTVIDYAAAGGAADIQVSVSAAATDEDWNSGNRDYYCFVSRVNAAELTTSIAIPQLSVVPIPAPAATPAP